MTVLVPVFATGQAFMETDCGDPYDSGRFGGFGPFDVNDRASADDITLVVTRHFTLWMEEMAINGFTLRPATTKEEMPGRQHSDLDYTLRAIPNHARALNAMGLYQLRLHNESSADFRHFLTSERNKGSLKPAECYYQRAIMFKPDDGVLYTVYGIFRHRNGQLDLALHQYKEAVRRMPDGSEAHYNIGLLYVELKQFEFARKHAKRAYELGYPLPGLRNTLARLGEWDASDAGSEITSQ